MKIKELKITDNTEVVVSNVTNITATATEVARMEINANCMDF